MNLSEGLLIYPFGNSDLAFNGEETFPRESYRDFRAHLETLKPLLKGSQINVRPLQLEGEAFPSGLDFTALPPEQRRTQRNQKEFNIETVRFPILFDVLRELLKELSLEGGQRSAKLHLQPIITDQKPPHPQDTVDIIPLLEVYIAFLNEYWQQAGTQFQLQLREPWTLRVTASDYDALLEPYREFYEKVQSTFAGFERVYFSLATGTPAMSVAAGLVFAGDPHITFVYKPRGVSTLTQVNTFRDRVQQETLSRLNTLLERFDFRGALEVIQAKKNGFTADETGTAAILLKALDAWQNYDFQQAAEVIQGLVHFSNISSLKPFQELCDCLAQDNPAPEQRAKFWRTKITDTLMRLEIAVYRRDLPDVLYQFYNYNDVCLAWGLNAHFSQLDVMEPAEDNEIKAVWDEFAQRCPGASRNLKSEGGKFQLLYALFEMKKHGLGEALQNWFQAHQLLRWFQDLYVDSKRHRLVHGSVQLQEELFDRVFRDALKEWGATEISVPPGQGPWLLLGLTHHSFEKLPDVGADGPSLVRNLAANAWETLAQRVSSTPPAPGWTQWNLEHSLIEAFEKELQRAFSLRSEGMQKRCEQFVTQWKESLKTDIKSSSLPKLQQRQLLEGLTHYKAPRWGDYLTQGFISFQHAEREIKFEPLACLDRSLNFRERPAIKTYLGQYLSGELTFDELFKKVNPSTNQPSHKQSKAKGGSGMKLRDIARKRPLEG